MRRLSRIAILGLILSLVLGACAPLTPAPESVTPTTASAAQTATPRPTSPPAPTPRPSLGVDSATLRGQTVVVWHAWTGDAAQAFQSQVAGFNQSNAWGITVTAFSQSDYNSLLESANAALQAGTAPDVVAALPEHALDWHAAGQVVDLTPYMHDPDYGWDDARADDIPTVFWAQDAIAGVRLGIPAARSARFLFYNQTWARELGFADAPATAEDFRKQACAANATFRQDADLQNDGLGGLLLDWQWQGAYAWLLAFGGGVLDESGAYAFDTPPNLDALTFLTDLRTRGCAWYSTEVDAFVMLRERRALFVSASLEQVTDQLRVMRQAGSNDQWTLIPFPGSAGQAVAVYGPSYVLLPSGNQARQLAAWLFINSLLEADNVTAWVQATGTLPLTRSSVPALAVYRGGRPQWGAAVDALSSAYGAPQRPSWRLVKLVLADGVEDLFRSNLPPDQIRPVILQGMDALAQELADGE